MVKARATTTVRTAMVGVLEAGRIVTHHVSTPPAAYLTRAIPL
jgi:hypothetical protein